MQGWYECNLANRISEQEERKNLVEDDNSETADDDQPREPALDILIPVQPEDYNIPDPPSPSTSQTDDYICRH